MSDEIISLRQWFETPPGRYLLQREREHFDTAVADVFGYHALQLGLGELDALRASRMSHKWLALPQPEAPVQAPVQAPLPDAQANPDAPPRAALVTDFSALPFAEASLDLVVLPHTLEFHPDPHATLREVERVLVPEGRVAISCLNPASLWGLRQRRARLYKGLGFGELFLPEAGDFIGYWRLRDWLRLLGFEVESSRFACWRPAMSSQKWLARYEWMDAVGERWWPIFGAAYFLVAVKRVRNARLLGPAWKNSAAMAAAPVPVANKARKHTRT